MSKYEERSPLLSDFRMEWVNRNFPRRGRQIVKRYVRGVRTLNRERVGELAGSSKLCLYVANHQTLLDYSIPMFAIIRDKLPYPRSVAGANLNTGAIRNLMVDIGKWGVIWFDRKDKSQTHVKEYLRAVRQTYEDGFSVLGFPEATRNRNVGGDPAEFKEAFFGAVLSAQRKIDRPIYVVNMAVDYDRIPEEGYYPLIDQGGRWPWLGSLRYFGWDAWASARWRYLDARRTTARVNFGVPVPITELAGSGMRKDQARNAAHNSYDAVVGLLNEARARRRAV